MTTDLAISTQLAQMQEMIARQQAEIAALREQKAGDGDGSLEMALREFERDHVQPTSFTTSPCQHTDGAGRLCARVFDAHVEERLGMNPMPLGHTFRLSRFEPSNKPKPRAFFAKDEPVAVVAVPETSIEDTYMSVAEAAKALKLKQTEVKALVADGQLKADTIPGSTFVRRVSVERIIAMAAVAEQDAEVI